MALAIILTDTHLSEKTIDINKSIFSQVISKAKELNLDKVFHGGDIFDSRKAQPLSVLKAFEDILEMFNEAGILFVAIPGNHDKNDYRSEDSYLDPYRHHPSFDLYSTFGSFILNEKYDLSLIPFFNESDTYSNYLNEYMDYIDLDKKTILLTHIAVNGVRNNDGSEVSNNITSELFSKFDKVLIGHYHSYSKVGDKVIYIGSAFQHNFGEDDKKGFTIIEDDGSISFFKSQFPEYQKIVINIEDYSPKQIEKILSDYDTEKNNVRLVLKGNYEQINSIDKNKLKQQGVDVKLEASEIQVSINEAVEDKFVSFDKKAIKEEFDEFCQINEIQNSEIGKNYLTQILN